MTHKKKHLTTNTVKLNFVKKTSKYAFSCQETFKISRAINREALEALAAIEILSASAVKRLVVEQCSFLKKLLSQILKLKVASFLRVELLHWILLKHLRVTEN